MSTETKPLSGKNEAKCFLKKSAQMIYPLLDDLPSTIEQLRAPRSVQHLSNNLI